MNFPSKLPAADVACFFKAIPDAFVISNHYQQGKTIIDIAQVLDISAFTANNHLQRAFKKLRVFNRTQAV